jgi:antitoxin ParD1/3/4
MNVSLTPSLEQYIRDRAATGDYNNASEVVREAIRLLKEKDEQRQLKISKLKESLKTGIADAESDVFADYALDTFLQDMDNKTNA